MKKKHSLPLAATLLLMLSLLALVMLGTITYSVYTSRVLTGDATAINLSGSLRMQSYRLGQALLASTNEAGIAALRDELTEKLASAELAHAIPDNRHHPISRRYQAVVERWNHLQHMATDQPDAYLAQVDEFVALIHDLVFALEVRSEQTVANLYRNQVIAMTIFLVLFALFGWLILYRLVRPLSLLKQTAKAISANDLHRRSHYLASDELGVLSQALDQMADHLVETNATLEIRVQEQTEQLQRKTETLAFLFNLSRVLSQGVTPLPLLMQQQTQGLAQVANLKRVSWQDQHHFRSDDLCHGSRLGNSDTWLIIESDIPLADWQRQLADTCCELFHSSQNRLQQQKNQHRLALLEERSSLARELHDSLAQSLSYLKMLVAKWHKLHQKQASDEQLKATVKDIESGLGSAYRRLRELLVTFRMRPEHSDLSSAIAASVEEFSRCSPALFQLHVDPDWPELNANQEMHCLHIVREALNNIIKHANATKVSVNMERHQHECYLRIADDGDGLPDELSSMDRFGLGIMTERSHRIGGHCLIHRLPTGGTEVLLRFPITPNPAITEATS
ncbi:MAG: type IV pili methyl-accepting chemotaxis transducer N-terminal domain-containing protein [Saccharospirillum sp.]|nr:type IV pili methyl-accepting chemotaxis transducer N-terminal domain-containing protein [Saccharospirillum sp.]